MVLERKGFHTVNCVASIVAQVHRKKLALSFCTTIYIQMVTDAHDNNERFASRRLVAWGHGWAIHGIAAPPSVAHRPSLSRAAAPSAVRVGMTRDCRFYDASTILGTTISPKPRRPDTEPASPCA